MDRIELCNEKMNEIFGLNPVQNEGDDPEFMHILQRFIFGEVCYTGGLDNRMRELITVTVLAVNQTYPQLTAHVKGALHVGCSPIEIREAVYQCAGFIGFPKTLNAIAAMNEAFKAQNVALPLEDTTTVADEERYKEGLALQTPIYGGEIKDRYAYLPDEFATAIPHFLTELCFGDFMSRKGLDGKTRELLILVMLAAIGGCETQVYSHAIGALKTGNSKDEVVCALVHAMPYMGIPKLFNALNTIKPLL